MIDQLRQPPPGYGIANGRATRLQKTTRLGAMWPAVWRRCTRTEEGIHR